MKNFEMADSKNPLSIIKATQRSVIKAMRDIVDEVKRTYEETGDKLPGLTFEQIYYLFDAYENKDPKVFFQKEEQ